MPRSALRLNHRVSAPLMTHPASSRLMHNLPIAVATARSRNRSVSAENRVSARRGRCSPIVRLTSRSGPRSLTAQAQRQGTAASGGIPSDSNQGNITPAQQARDLVPAIANAKTTWAVWEDKVSCPSTKSRTASRIGELLPLVHDFIDSTNPVRRNPSIVNACLLCSL